MSSETDKLCPVCRLSKPRSEFYTRGGGRPYVRSECKVCTKARIKRKETESPELTAYRYQRKGAMRRGIEWGFTFDSWLKWWGDDLYRRGCTAGCLVMARRGDTGPYKPSNCVKLPAHVNVKHALRRASYGKRLEATTGEDS